MSGTLSRRQFNRLLALGAAAGAVLSTTSLAPAAEQLRLIWWGNPDRDRRTNEVVDLYMKEMAGTEVSPETYAWNDYWQKLATQAAGRNLPDLIQMDYRFIFEYVRRGQLAALDPFVGKEIDLSDFDPNQLESGKVDGKLYGISLGANSMSFAYKKKVLDDLGVTLPDPTKWTTEDFEAIGRQIKDKLPSGMYASSNMGYNEPSLEMWVRQRGKQLYTADGKLGFDLADLTDFFAYWKRLQDEGLTPPADLMSQAIGTGKMEDTMMATGHSVFEFLHSNQLVAMQKLNQDEVALTMIPNQPGGKPGQYLKPSMFISMSETAPDKTAAAKFINFFVTDPKAATILQIERGVTGDASIREGLTAGLNDTEKKMIQYLDTVGTSVSPLPPPPPKNAGEIDRAQRSAWEAIAFGKVSVEDGAKAHYDNAVRILERS